VCFYLSSSCFLSHGGVQLSCWFSEFPTRQSSASSSRLWNRGPEGIAICQTKTTFFLLTFLLINSSLKSICQILPLLVLAVPHPSNPFLNCTQSTLLIKFHLIGPRLSRELQEKDRQLQSLQSQLRARSPGSSPWVSASSSPAPGSASPAPGSSSPAPGSSSSEVCPTYVVSGSGRSSPSTSHGRKWMACVFIYDLLSVLRLTWAVVRVFDSQPERSWVQIPTCVDRGRVP